MLYLPWIPVTLDIGTATMELPEIKDNILLLVGQWDKSELDLWTTKVLSGCPTGVNKK